VSHIFGGSRRRFAASKVSAAAFDLTYVIDLFSAPDAALIMYADCEMSHRTTTCLCRQ
jgi:hypothetical protein